MSTRIENGRSPQHPPFDPAVPAPPVSVPPVPAPGQPALQVLAAPQAHVGQQLNCSHFRPEFTGKPEEDVEAHLLHTYDWMNTHNFPDVRVQRFCLMMVGEGR